MAEPIVFERVIDATPDEAFALFSEPERLRRWMALSASIDLRVDGEVRLAVVPGNVNRGTITDLDPGHRFEWTWGWEGGDAGPGSSTVAVDFEAHDGGTLVRMTHRGLSADDAVGHTEGWTHYLGRLADAAARELIALDLAVRVHQRAVLVREGVAAGDGQARRAVVRAFVLGVGDGVVADVALTFVVRWRGLIPGVRLVVGDGGGFVRAVAPATGEKHRRQP